MRLVLQSLRSLSKAPGFALVVILALALGIGANSAIYTAIHGIFGKPLAYAEPDRLVQLTEDEPASQIVDAGMSWTRIAAIRARPELFERLGVAIGTAFIATGNGQAEQLIGMHVDHDFLPTLGITPSLGRAFTAEEDSAGGPDVALLSDAYWKQRFGGRADVVGQSLILDGRPHTIVGVMPATATSFPFNQVRVFTPRPREMSFLAPVQIDNGGYFFNAIARLAPGSSVEQVNAALGAIDRQYSAGNEGKVDRRATSRARVLVDSLVGNQRGAYLLLFGAVGVLLMLACANVANLTLSRMAGRRKQIAIRFALGAKRRHVIAELVTENLLLAVAGGLVGLAVAQAAVVLMAKLGAGFIPRIEEIALDRSVVVFSLGLALVTGAVLGLIPAWHTRPGALVDELKDANRETTGGRSQQRLRNLLLVGEVGLSFMLLIAAGLLIASFARLQAVRVGFEPDGIYTAFIQTPQARYPERSQALAGFYNSLVDKLAALPGVEHAALCDSPPFTGAGAAPFAVVGQPIPPMAEQKSALRQIVSAGYFATLGVPLLRGRDFDAHDVPGSPAALIVNESFARAAFGDADPIGRHVLTGMMQMESEIVGVVADFRALNLNSPPQPQMYHPSSQRPENFTGLLVKTKRDPATLGPQVRAAVAALDSDVPVTNEGSITTLMAATTANQQAGMALLGGFALLAVILAGLGVYSVIAYSVGQRRAEIGVRLALGARPADVRGMVLRQGMRLTAIGLVLGIVGAGAVAKLMATLLFDAGLGDALLFVAVAAGLGLIAALACWIPARRAAAVDPVASLQAGR